MDPTIIFLPASFALLAFVAWVVAGAWRHPRELRLRADFQTLRCIASAPLRTVADFLSTPVGREFAQALLTEPPPSNTDRVMQALQVGIVLAATGVGLLMIALVGR